MKQLTVIILVMLLASSAVFAQDSLNVLKVGSCNIPAYKIAQDDDYLYTIGRGILGVFDVNDPIDPQEICRFETLPGTEDIAVFGDYVYLANIDSGVVIIDVSDPENPTDVGRVAEGLSVWGLDIQDDILYIAALELEIGLQAFDLMEPATPRFLGSMDPVPAAFHVYVHGNHAFVPTLFDGIRIVDVSDPSDMTLIGGIDIFPSSFSVTFVNDIAYIAALVPEEEGMGMVCAVDISNPNDPEELGRLGMPAGAVHIISRDDNAYVVCENSGLRILDVSSHFEMEEVGFYDTPGMAEHVALGADDVIYVADMNELGIYQYIPPESVNGEVTVPLEFRIVSAFPNPFNNTTTIGYSLPAAGVVSLAVYDLSGREVVNLAEGMMPAGTHEAVWTADGMASGVYVVKLEAGGVSAREKVVLVR